MSEHEDGLDEQWHRDVDQAQEDIWAIRILDCPNRTCGRTRSCLNPAGCPALAKHPTPKAADQLLLNRLRRLLLERKRAIDAGPAADAARRERWKRDVKRRRRIAFARAREVLGR